MASDKIVGLLMVLVALAGIAAELYYLVYLPISDNAAVQMTASIFWALAIPVLLGTILVLLIVLWIGWTMVTTPPPEPISLEEFEDLDAAPAEEKKTES